MQNRIWIAMAGTLVALLSFTAGFGYAERHDHVASPSPRVQRSLETRARQAAHRFSEWLGSFDAGGYRASLSRPLRAVVRVRELLVVIGLITANCAVLQVLFWVVMRGADVDASFWSFWRRPS